MDSSTLSCTPPLSIYDSPTETEMALSNIPLTAQLGKAQCPGDMGEIISQYSPDLARFHIPRHKTKLQLPKWLKPRLKSASTTKIIPTTTEIREPLALQSEDNNAETSVQQPSASPTDENFDNLKQKTATNPTQTIETILSHPDLRRISNSYHNLRSFAAIQSQLGNLDNAVHSPAITPLLPSPVVYEKSNENSKAYFQLPKRTIGYVPNEYASYEELRILSCYGDEEEDLDQLNQFNRLFNPDESEDIDISDSLSLVEDDNDEGLADDESTASEPMPITPTDKVSRNSVFSEESNWLANTTSHEDRLRRVKARCFQVVQHPMSRKAIRNEDGIMLATVLVGPGKPKLVQIRRPSSSSSQDQPQFQQKQSSLPTTPEQNHNQEFSAFSPYDTPGGPYETQMDISSGISEQDDENTFSCNSLVPPPLQMISQVDSGSQPKQNSRNAILNSTLDQLQRLDDPFSQSADPEPAMQKNILLMAQGLSSPTITTTTTTSPTLHATLLTQHRKIDRILKNINTAIQHFPTNTMLNLDSPIMQDLQQQSSSQDSSTYINALQKIFTQAPTILLSSLAAWLLVDIYLSKLVKSGCDSSSCCCSVGSNSTRSSLERHQEVHEMQSHRGMQWHKTKRDEAKYVQWRLQYIRQRLLETLRGKWDADIWISLTVLVEVIHAGLEVSRLSS